MGDYDSEIYRSVNDIYGEVSSIKANFSQLNDSLMKVVQELQGLRQDMKQRAGP